MENKVIHQASYYATSRSMS